MLKYPHGVPTHSFLDYIKHQNHRRIHFSSRGSFIITQKENKGEYNSGWEWNNATYDYDIYAHVMDQANSSGIPYRYNSATSFGSNACTNDKQITHGKTAYSSISEQLSCNPSTLNAGNWYSFPAATAGSDMHTGWTTAENSICPKGWQLPPDSGNKSYNTLIRTAYQIADGPSDSVDSNLLANSAMSFVRLGHYAYDYGSLGNRGSGGFYWLSAASSDTSSRILNFTSEYLYPRNSGKRAYGMSLRCVSR